MEVSEEEDGSDEDGGSDEGDLSDDGLSALAGGDSSGGSSGAVSGSDAESGGADEGRSRPGGGGGMAARKRQRRQVADGAPGDRPAEGSGAGRVAVGAGIRAADARLQGSDGAAGPGAAGPPAPAGRYVPPAARAAGAGAQLTVELALVQISCSLPARLAYVSCLSSAIDHA